MSRITREMANKAAEQLAIIAYDKKIEKVSDDLRQEVEKIIKEYIPSPIIQMMAEYAGVLENMAQLCITDGNGHCVYYYNPPIKLPHVNAIAVNIDDFKRLHALREKLDSLNNEKYKYKYKVSDALCLSLRTESRIKECFPEALPYLNFSGSTALMADFSDLRNILKQ